MSCLCLLFCSSLFFFNHTATTELYTLSLHDALPISTGRRRSRGPGSPGRSTCRPGSRPCRSSAGPSASSACSSRSEEHTSELQSRLHLVCRLLLEKKKQQNLHPQNLQLYQRHTLLHV